MLRLRAHINTPIARLQEIFSIEAHRKGILDGRRIVREGSWKAYYLSRRKEYTENLRDASDSSLIRNIVNDPQCVYRFSHLMSRRILSDVRRRVGGTGTMLREGTVFSDFHHGIHHWVYANHDDERQYEIAKRFVSGEVEHPTPVCVCQSSLVVDVTFAQQRLVAVIHTAKRGGVYCFCETGGSLSAELSEITRCRQQLLRCTATGEALPGAPTHTHDEALDAILTQMRSHPPDYPHGLHTSLHARKGSEEYALGRKWILANCEWDPDSAPVTPQLIDYDGVRRILPLKTLHALLGTSEDNGPRDVFGVVLTKRGHAGYTFLYAVTEGGRRVPNCPHWAQYFRIDQLPTITVDDHGKIHVEQISVDPPRGVTPVLMDTEHNGDVIDSTQVRRVRSCAIM